MTKWIIPYDGTDWFYTDDRRPNFYEAILLEEISGGLTGEALTQALVAEKPRAWLAALVVARKRSGMPTDRARKVDLDRVEMEDAIDATYAEMQRTRADATAEPAPDEPQTPRRARRAKAPESPADDQAAGVETLTVTSA